MVASVRVDVVSAVMLTPIDFLFLNKAFRWPVVSAQSHKPVWLGFPFG